MSTTTVTHQLLVDERRDGSTEYRHPGTDKVLLKITPMPHTINGNRHAGVTVFGPDGYSEAGSVLIVVDDNGGIGDELLDKFVALVAGYISTAVNA